MEKNCDKCGKLVKIKYIKKIRGILYCGNCASELRLKRRQETIKLSGISQDLKILDRKMNREYQQKRRESIKSKSAKIHFPFIRKKYTDSDKTPKIKGAKVKKYDNNNYLSMVERQVLFGILRKKGFTTEEADTRIKKLQQAQKDLRIKLKEKHKSEKEIKQKQQKLLEELWNY